MRTWHIAAVIVTCLMAASLVAAPVSDQSEDVAGVPNAAEIDLFAWDACQHEWRVDVATQATVAPGGLAMLTPTGTAWMNI